MADKKIEQYCKEVTDEFVNKYLEELDNNIYKMLNAFGYEGDVNESGEWLENKNYELRMDEDKGETSSMKKIYLVDNEVNMVIGIFAVKIYGEEDLNYEFSDVYILKDED